MQMAVLINNINNEFMRYVTILYCGNLCSRGESDLKQIAVEDLNPEDMENESVTDEYDALFLMLSRSKRASMNLTMLRHAINEC